MKAVRAGRIASFLEISTRVRRCGLFSVARAFHSDGLGGYPLLRTNHIGTSHRQVETEAGAWVDFQALKLDDIRKSLFCGTVPESSSSRSVFYTNSEQHIF